MASNRVLQDFRGGSDDSQLEKSGQSIKEAKFDLDLEEWLRFGNQILKVWVGWGILIEVIVVNKDKDGRNIEVPKISNFNNK